MKKEIKKLDQYDYIKALREGMRKRAHEIANGTCDWKVSLLYAHSEIINYECDMEWPIIKFGIQVGDGWKDIVETLFRDMGEHAREKGLNLYVQQVKEKFGGLRVYVAGGDDTILKMIRAAEMKSVETCECCGTKENVGRTTGWILTCCEACYTEHANERVRAREWVRNEPKGDGDYGEKPVDESNYETIKVNGEDIVTKDKEQFLRFEMAHFDETSIDKFKDRMEDSVIACEKCGVYYWEGCLKRCTCGNQSQSD